MKFRKWLFLAAAAGGVAAYLQQQKQLEPAADEGIWKPVDPLRPFGARSDETPSEDAPADTDSE